MNDAASPPRPDSLTRRLGVLGATMLGLGSILGTGVFVSIGLAADLAGPAVLVAIVLAALLATCNALSSAQLAAAHPVSGGTYEYGYRLLTPRAGFLAGWTFLCAKTASAATAAMGVAGYALALAGVSSGAARSVAAGVVAAAVTTLVLSGLRRSSAVNVVIVSITIGSLLAFVVAGLWEVSGDRVEALAPAIPTAEGWRSFLTATALMFVAYTGYGRVATMGEEVRDPRRVIPLAIVSTLGISAVLYLLVAAAGLLAVGADGLSAATTLSGTPLGTAAFVLGGPTLGLVLAVGAVTAMLGVLLNLVLGLSRVALAMGRRGDLPSWLAHLSFGAEPVAAVLLVGAAITLLALFGSVKSTWSFSALTVLVYYALTNLAALRLPRRERLYPAWISASGLVGCTSLALFIPPRVWLWGLLLVAAGFGFRALLRSRRGRDGGMP